MRKSIAGLLVAGVLWGAGAQAETFLGFRLLDLDGVQVRWGGNPNSDAPVVVSWALVGQARRFEGARNCASLVPLDGLLERSRLTRDQLRAELVAAFDMWQAVANIEFRETPDPDAAGILIGAQERPEGRAFANVHYAPGRAGRIHAIERSLICLNPGRRWKVGFDGNLDVYDLRYTLAHEIGHAIGLDHPEPANQLMSFRYGERFRELQAGDIGGAVKIYGARALVAEPAGLTSMRPASSR